VKSRNVCNKCTLGEVKKSKEGRKEGRKKEKEKNKQTKDKKI